MIQKNNISEHGMKQNMSKIKLNSVKKSKKKSETFVAIKGNTNKENFD